MSQVFANLQVLINLSKKSLEDILWETYDLIDLIKAKRGRFHFGDSKEDATNEEKNLDDCFSTWKIFSRKKIPFELWGDLCEEGIELLKKLLEDPSIPYTELPGFKEFDDKVYERVKELKFKHGYADRFTMDAYN